MKMRVQRADLRRSGSFLLVRGCALPPVRNLKERARYLGCEGDHPLANATIRRGSVATRMAYRWEYQRLTRRNTTEGVLRCMPLSEGYRSILSTVIAWDQNAMTPAVPVAHLNCAATRDGSDGNGEINSEEEDFLLSRPFPAHFPAPVLSSPLRALPGKR